MPTTSDTSAIQNSTTTASGPNGLKDYFEFNSTSGGIMGQLEQLGNDLINAAKNFIGISDDIIPQQDEHQYKSSSETFTAATEEMGKDIRNMPQVFRSIKNEKLNKSCSYLMSNGDFLYCDILDMNTKDNFMSKPQIQKIVLNEYQPYDNIFLGQAIDALDLGITKLLGKIGSFIGEAGGRAFLRNRLIDDIAADPSNFYANSEIYDSYGNYIGAEADAKNAGIFSFLSMKTDPMLKFLRMFPNGHWLNTYELPFYGNNYLDENSGGSWNQEGSKKQWSAGISTALEGFGVYYPTTPTWNLDIKNAMRPQLDLEFYLINKNEEWMLRNFKFMHALFSGTQFVLMNSCIVQSPNVYNVHVDGRFEIIWASMTMSASIEGKLRKCSFMDTMLNTNYNPHTKVRTSKIATPKTVKVTSKIDGKEVDKTIYEGNNGLPVVSVNKPLNMQYSGLKSINRDTLWPDAWKIKLHIKDLGVNCFNNYLNYQMYGSSGARLRANTINKSFNTLTVEAINELIDSMIDNISDTEKRAKAQELKMEYQDQIEEGVNDANATMQRLYNNMK